MASVNTGHSRTSLFIPSLLSMVLFLIWVYALSRDRHFCKFCSSCVVCICEFSFRVPFSGFSTRIEKWVRRFCFKVWILTQMAYYIDEVRKFDYCKFMKIRQELAFYVIGQISSPLMKKLIAFNCVFCFYLEI